MIMIDLCLSFPVKCLTFAATFPTAVLNLIFEHNSERRGWRQHMATLSSIAVGPKAQFPENAFGTI